MIRLCSVLAHCERMTKAQDFELFCMAWMQVQPLRLRLGCPDAIAVDAFFKSGLCSASTKDLSLSLQRLESTGACQKLAKRWPFTPVRPHRKEAPTAFLNGAQAEACDGAILQLVADTKGQHLDALFQMKLTATGLTLNLAMIEAEHQKAVDFRRDPKAARKAAKKARKAKKTKQAKEGEKGRKRKSPVPQAANDDDRFLFVLITNRKLENEVVPEALPRDTIVIGQDQLLDFFGPVLVARARLLSELPVER